MIFATKSQFPDPGGPRAGLWGDAGAARGESHGGDAQGAVRCSFDLEGLKFSQQLGQYMAMFGNIWLYMIYMAILVYGYTSSTRTRRGGSGLRDIRPFTSIEFACAVRQPGPCVRTVCECVALLPSRNMTCVRPPCTATPSKAFFTLHMHLALQPCTSTRHTCTSHFALHLISPHLSSSYLISFLLISFHVIPCLFSCHLRSFSSLSWSRDLVRQRSHKSLYPPVFLSTTRFEDNTHLTPPKQQTETSHTLLGNQGNISCSLPTLNHKHFLKTNDIDCKYVV